MSMVEWKKLGEIEDAGILELGRGQVISKNDMRDNPGEYPVYSSSSQGDGEVGRYGLYMFDDERITWSIDGGGKPFYRNNLKYSVTNVGGWLKVHKDDVYKTKFLYYLLFNQWTFKTFDYTHKAHPSVIRNEYLIPNLSLSEQSRIVGILDTFTASIANLKEQIGERRKQYNYLIDNMFGGSYEKMLELGDRGELLLEPLSSHGVFTRGRRFVRTDVVENGMPCIHYGDMYTYYGIMAKVANTFLPYDFPKKMRYAKKGDVVIVGAGENNEDIGVGVAWLGDEPAAVHDACYIYESDFDAVFLSYYLRSSIYHHQIKSNVVRGKICSISSDGIGRALIPIYSIEKQKKIVESLLPFEASIANLEAQLQEREKQYEHYRNLLLTFE